jgi:hypothetical protein
MHCAKLGINAGRRQRGSPPRARVRLGDARRGGRRRSACSGSALRGPSSSMPWPIPDGRDCRSPVGTRCDRHAGHHPAPVAAFALAMVGSPSGQPNSRRPGCTPTSHPASTLPSRWPDTSSRRMRSVSHAGARRRVPVRTRAPQDTANGSGDGPPSACCAPGGTEDLFSTAAPYGAKISKLTSNAWWGRHRR